MLRGALAKMMPTARLDADVAEALLRDAARMSPDAMIGFFQALHRFDVAPRLATLRVPTVVLAGGKDVLVPAAATQELAALLPRGELRVWPEVGHSPQLERPDEFLALLVAGARRSPLMRLRTWWWRAWRRLRGLPAAGSRAIDTVSAGADI
jgi:branched-chain amino acid transport system permease protein